MTRNPIAERAIRRHLERLTKKERSDFRRSIRREVRRINKKQHTPTEGKSN